MKLILVLICALGLLSSVAENSYAQSTKLSVEFKGASIKSVLQYIENNSEFSFMYENNLVDVSKKVDIQTQNETIDVVLGELLGSEIEYRIYGKHILLFPSEESALKYNKENMLAQQNTVSGVVTDETGQPLPGATVVVKGTTQGTVTNADGNYSLSSVTENAILQFSFVGMQTQEIEIGDQTTINITLVADAIGIEEVVAIGYGTQKKESVTGSISTISAKNLTVVPASNTNSVLAGRMPGLIMRQATGRPGSDVGNLFVRGFGANNSSSSADESPLIIVDGIERSFSQLDQNEIESITILKDASAAIYGARAASGVVLVTTKRGVLGKPTITYNGSQSFQQPTIFPEFVNAKEYYDLFPTTLAIPQERFNAIMNGEEPGTNWYDAITRPFAPMHKHNLNIRGGSDNVKYFVSTGYLNQGSIFETKDYGFQRLNVTSNLDVTISKNLSASFDLGWRRELREDYRSNPLEHIAVATPAYPASWPDPAKTVFVGISSHSPVAYASKDINGSIDRTIDVLTGGIKLAYKIPWVKGLSVDGKVGMVNQQTYTKNFEKKYALWEYDGEDYIQRAEGNINRLTELQNRFLRITTQLALRYSNTFGDHSLSGLLLHETVNETANVFQASRSYLLSSALPYLFTGSADGQSATGSASEDGRESLVGRLNYGYNDKYLLEISFRYDASPRFPEDTRWGFFPGLSLGWRLSEEDFMKDSKFIHNMRLRASASRLGNDNTNGSYDYLTGYSIVGSLQNWYSQGGELITAISPLSEPNLYITWQESDLYNIGLTSSYLEGKLGFEVDAFYRKRSNLLATSNAAIPNTTGASLPLRNINSRDNRGVEAMVSYSGMAGKLRYTVSGNFTWVREKYIHYEEREFEEGDDERINKRSGQWVNRTFGYVFDGFWNSQDEIDNATVNQDGNGNITLRPGDVKILDLNDDGIINSYDRKVIGKSNVPELFFGLNFSAQWKGFDFEMLWQGASGFAHNMAAHERTPVDYRTTYKYIYDNLWTTDNKENAFFPARDAAQNNWVMDKYLVDATYVRLKNLSIGYTLDRSIVNKIGASNLRVYISGANLLTIDGMGSYPVDPESGSTYTYPPQRVYSLGINVSF